MLPMLVPLQVGMVEMHGRSVVVPGLVVAVVVLLLGPTIPRAAMASVIPAHQWLKL